MLHVLKKMIYFSGIHKNVGVILLISTQNVMIEQDAYEYKNYLDQILLPHMREMFYKTLCD